MYVSTEYGGFDAMVSSCAVNDPSRSGVKVQSNDFCSPIASDCAWVSQLNGDFRGGLPSFTVQFLSPKFRSTTVPCLVWPAGTLPKSMIRVNASIFTDAMTANAET